MLRKVRLYTGIRFILISLGQVLYSTSNNLGLIGSSSSSLADEIVKYDT